MEKIICESQTTFIKGRNIMNGVVVMNKIIKEAMKKKKNILIFKADFAKAFDFVNWNYLFDMMWKMCFLRKWIN